MVAKYQEQLAEVLRLHNVKRGAEIGVHAGKFSQFLLSYLCLDKLYSIDCWEVNSENHDPDGTFHAAKQRLEVFRERSEIIKGYSIEVAKTFVDGSLDFVYIDALHDYAPCKEDSETWIKKIRKGGILCGDDYDWEGVRLAVDEIFPQAIILGKGEPQPQWMIQKS